MTAISPTLLLSKYQKTFQSIDNHNYITNIFISNNLKYPIKQIKKLKRMYTHQQIVQRIHLLWDNYYSEKQSDMISINTKNLRKYGTKLLLIQNFYLKIRKQISKYQHNPIQKQNMHIQHCSQILSNSFENDIKFIISKGTKSHKIFDTNNPFPKIAIVKNMKKKPKVQQVYFTHNPNAYFN